MTHDRQNVSFGAREWIALASCALALVTSLLAAAGRIESRLTRVETQMEQLAQAVEKHATSQKAGRPMLGLIFKQRDNTPAVTRAAEKAAFRNFGHAAASIRKDAAASIDKAEGPSPAGTPPHTHQGAYLKRSLRFAATKDGAVIGPMASVVGEAGAAHEFGGQYKGQDFEERAFMFPALNRNLARFAGEWKGSIGE